MLHLLINGLIQNYLLEGGGVGEQTRNATRLSFPIVCLKYTNLNKYNYSHFCLILSFRHTFLEK